MSSGEEDSTKASQFSLWLSLKALIEWIQRDHISLGLLIVSLIVTVTSCIHYLMTMLQWTDPGFNLDDSWIHLQYARTIFEGHPWEYSPGYPSTGSTSPLWSIILSFLFYFTTDPVGLILGTFGISIIFYVASSFLVGLIVTDYTNRSLWGSFGILGFVIFPRNTWLMLSGMETPLFVFIMLLSVYLLDKPGWEYDIAIGITAGLAYLSRPEGILIGIMCVPIRFLILLKKGRVKPIRFLGLLVTAGIALTIVTPWIFHCIRVTGHPLPATFYAKTSLPPDVIEVWTFWWGVWLLEYPCIILGIITGIVLSAKGKPYTWLLALSLTVSYRLMATYASLLNNFRYLVPVFNLYVITAIAGTVVTINEITRIRLDKPSDQNMRSVTSILIIGLIIIPLIPGYLDQASFFGNAVKNINEQQVHIGRWLAQNTPEKAVFAIHDAGALRFFSNRTVIDLVGIVSPAIMQSNMTAIETILYLKEQGCEYFVFFDELFVFWSFYLHGGYTKLYTVVLPDNVISGRDTMSVWHIDWNNTPYAAMGD